MLDLSPMERGQGSNPHPHRDNARSLTCWAIMGTPPRSFSMNAKLPFLSLSEPMSLGAFPVRLVHTEPGDLSSFTLCIIHGIIYITNWIDVLYQITALPPFPMHIPSKYCWPSPENSWTKRCHKGKWMSYNKKDCPSPSNYMWDSRMNLIVNTVQSQDRFHMYTYKLHFL